MARITSGTAAPALEVHDAPGAISYSQLRMLHPAYKFSCPRQWGYRYRLALPERKSAAMILGSAFDKACNMYFSLRQIGTESLTAATRGLEVGAAHLRSEAELDPDLFDPAELDAQLLTAWPAFLVAEGRAEVACVQDRHEFILGLDDEHQLPVVGYSDRIDTDGTIVDHKVSGIPRWRDDGTWQEDWVAERRDQLLIYWLGRNAAQQRENRQAAAENRPPYVIGPPLSQRARLVVVYTRKGLVKAQVRSCDLTLNFEDEASELLLRLAEAGRIAQANRYPARPGQACSWCSFVDRCRTDEAERGTTFFEICGVPF